MTAIIKKVTDVYDYVLEDLSDSRMQDYPMMSSPFPTIYLSLIYLIFVTKIGPRLMKNREPFQINNILIVYNAFQTIFSMWLFYEGSVHGWLNNYSFICTPADYSLSPQQRKMLAASWWFYISRFVEFSDTVFFVLRKKFDQVSALHVIHHALVPIITWIGAKFVPGGHFTLAGYLNAFVHIIMYAYYTFSAMGPKYRKYLWWKKYLTVLQLVQFVLVLLHTTLTVVIDCDVAKPFTGVIAFQATLFFFLFTNFYKKEYIHKKKMQELQKISSPLSNGTSKTKNNQGSLNVEQNDTLDKNSGAFKRRRKQNNIQ